MDNYSNCLNKLRSLRESTNWQIEEERRELLRQLYSLAKEWEGQLPDLSTIFHPEEVDWLLVQDVFGKDDDAGTIVDFAIVTGYKDHQTNTVDEGGRPQLQRATALHRLIRSSRTANHRHIVPKLFQIYHRLDANYVDASSGLTHFHVACRYGYLDVVRKFLELGQNPNRLVKQTGDSPLHLALIDIDETLIDALLRHGADPNLANAAGSTPLHVICSNPHRISHRSARLFLDVCDELRRPALVDARDKLGETPLHKVRYDLYETVALLLGRGADPNLANNEGETYLHMLCKMDEDDDHADDLAEKFLSIGRELGRPVQIDARDRLGRTPLQWAVANLKPHAVDVLLAHGTDLSSFVFPTEDYFAATYTLECTLHVVVFITMSIVESLERRGYEMDQTAALTIMKTFAKHGLIDEPKLDVAECLRRDEEFARIAKWQLVAPDLSLHDFLQLPLERAERVFALTDYDEFTREIAGLRRPESHRAYVAHLCDVATRGFFRRWALKLFSEKSPWLSEQCCQQIIGQLEIKRLWDICMEAAGQDTRWLAAVRTDHVKKFYHKDLASISYS
ncbi:hypothetical protein TKK_0010724 [Trichogramma kaykai]